MDNIIIISKTLDLAQRNLKTTLRVLEDLGWQVNHKKSKLEPSQLKEFLGLLGAVPVRKLAAVVGQGVALTRAILPAKLLLRNAYRDIARRTSWAALVKLSQATISDLEEWRHGLSTWNGRVATLRPHDVLIDTDASLSGWGAVMAPTSSSPASSAAGWWPRDESRHINSLKITAVLNALLTFCHAIRNKSVRICCNNIATVAHLNNMGGRSVQMNLIMRDIHRLCKSLNVQLLATYLPGSINMEADRLSCLHPHHKWALSCRLFLKINRIWGPHTINRTATADNKQLLWFNSRFAKNETKATDCLLQDWSCKNNWAAPPITLIPRILNLVERQRATATLIAPIWAGCHWFSQLERLSIDHPLPILNFLLLEFVLELLCNHHWKWAAFRISGCPNQQAGLQQQQPC